MIFFDFTFLKHSFPHVLQTIGVNEKMGNARICWKCHIIQKWGLWPFWTTGKTFTLPAQVRNPENSIPVTIPFGQLAKIW